MKNVFVVLTPPRCGSSCVARALQALGVDLGTDLMTPNSSNAKGFFEDNAIKSINARLFEYSKQPQNGALNPLKADIFSSACSLLESRLKSYRNYGFKDPVTIKFFPFWQKVFETLNLNDSYAIAIRNPLGAAHSMRAAHSLPPAVNCERELLAWLDHILPAFEFTKNKKRVFVDYDEMINSPKKQLDRISNALSLSHSQNESELKIYYDAFLDKSLQHHKYTFEQLKSKPEVFPLCITVYSCLLKLARDETDFKNKDFQIAWEAIENQAQQTIPIYRQMSSLIGNYEEQLKKSRDLYTKTFPLYRQMESLLKNYEQQLKKAQDLCTQYEKSLSWRITRPLRTMKKFFTDHPKM